jgi:hypothetical protein
LRGVDVEVEDEVDESSTEVERGVRACRGFGCGMELRAGRVGEGDEKMVGRRRKRNRVVGIGFGGGRLGLWG